MKKRSRSPSWGGRLLSRPSPKRIAAASPRSAAARRQLGGPDAGTDEIWIGYRQRPSSIQASLTLAKLEDWMVALEGYAAELCGWDVEVGPETHTAIAAEPSCGCHGRPKVETRLASRRSPFQGKPAALAAHTFGVSCSVKGTLT